MKYLKKFESSKEKLYKQISHEDFNESFKNRSHDHFSEREIKTIEETIYKLYRENVEAEFTHPITRNNEYIKVEIDVHNKEKCFIFYIYKRQDEYFYIKKIRTYYKSKAINYECDTLEGVIQFFNHL